MESALWTPVDVLGDFTLWCTPRPVPSSVCCLFAGSPTSMAAGWAESSRVESWQMVLPFWCFFSFITKTMT